MYTKFSERNGPFFEGPHMSGPRFCVVGDEGSDRARGVVENVLTLGGLGGPVTNERLGGRLAKRYRHRKETPTEQRMREVVEGYNLPPFSTFDGPEWNEVRVLHWDGQHRPIAHDVFIPHLSLLQPTDEGPYVFGEEVDRDAVYVPPARWHRLAEGEADFKLQQFLANERRQSKAEKKAKRDAKAKAEAKASNKAHGLLGKLKKTVRNPFAAARPDTGSPAPATPAIPASPGIAGASPANLGSPAAPGSPAAAGSPAGAGSPGMTVGDADVVVVVPQAAVEVVSKASTIAVVGSPGMPSETAAALEGGEDEEVKEDGKGGVAMGEDEAVHEAVHEAAAPLGDEPSSTGKSGKPYDYHHSPVRGTSGERTVDELRDLYRRDKSNSTEQRYSRSTSFR